MTMVIKSTIAVNIRALTSSSARTKSRFNSSTRVRNFFTSASYWSARLRECSSSEHFS